MTNIITNLQLRAARQVLNIGIRDLEKILKVSKSTISKAEQGKTRDFFYKHSAALIDFFKKNNVTFPNEHTIRFNIRTPKNNEIPLKPQTITRFQLKAARCVMGLSQKRLAKTIGIDKGILSRAELLDNFQSINPAGKGVTYMIKDMFLKHNIEFPDPYSIFFKKYIDISLNK